MDAPVTLDDTAVGELAVGSEIHTSLEVIGKLYNYNHWIFNKVRPFIRGSVCEIGSGIGNITQFLLNHERVVGVEPYGRSFRSASERFAAHRNVSFAPCTLEQCPNENLEADSFDTVVCLNVLEHIADDLDALRRMRALCRVGGRVVILVPALMGLYGSLDHSFGHYRRYGRRGLRRLFEQAGLRVVWSSYMNAIGVIGWLWEGRVLRRRNISTQSAKTFNRMVPFVDAFERVFRPPFGQSVIAVGQRTAAAVPSQPDRELPAPEHTTHGHAPG
jgi:SAM-dependent methyltransferase